MAIKTKAALKRFKIIKNNVDESYEEFSENRERFHKFMRFVFKEALTDEERQILEEINRPDLECNSVEPYISRLLGEFLKQEPSIKVTAIGDMSDTQTIEVVEGIMRSILYEANNDQFEYLSYKESLGGGFGAIKVWSEYQSEESMTPVLRLGRAYDPTLTGFDSLARTLHKGDGRFCYEIFPKTREEFEEEWPNEDISSLKFVRGIEGFAWSYRDTKQDVIMMADYYEKKKKKMKLHFLTNGQSMTDEDYQSLLENWQQIEQPPQIVRSRWTHKAVVMRYVFIEDRILEMEETDFKELPIIFVDGNSVHIKKDPNKGLSQFMTRPYAYHALGPQRLKNFAGQTLAGELESSIQAKFIISDEALPDDDQSIQDWLQPQKLTTLIKKERDPDGNPLTPPQVVQRAPIPPEIMQTFMSADQVIQATLGSYDAQLGINKKDLSGIAIVEGATQNNAVAMPYVAGFMAALGQAAQIILEMIPLYYNTPRTVPIVDREGKRSYIKINQVLGDGSPDPASPQLNYDPSVLDVRVSPGYNFEVQKNRALDTIVNLMQASPAFNEMMNQSGLPVLMDNIDIRGADQLKKMAEEFTQKMQQQQAMAAQQGQQANPELMLSAKDLQLKEQKLMMEQQYKAQEIQLEQQKLENERLRIMMDAQTDRQNNDVALTRAQTERESKAADLAMKSMDQAHRHAQDLVPDMQ